MLAPVFDQHLCLLQRVEDLPVEQLVAQFTVDALIVAILPWRTRLYEQCLYANPWQPFPDRDGGELAAIVGADMIRWTVPGEQVSQTGQHIIVPQSSGNVDRQTFARELVDHRQHLDRTPIMGTVLNEVIGPDMVAPARPQADA